MDNSPQGSTPVPDPTLLTTQQLNQQIAALRELVFTRLDASDKAVSLLSENQTRVPTQLAVEIEHTKELTNEKFRTVNQQFSTIQTQFRERDIRVDENKAAAAKGVEAAFAASEKVGMEQNRNFKESIEKSERGTQKVIDQISVQLATVQKTLDDKVADLRETVTRQDATITAMNASKVENRESTGATMYIIFSAIATILALAAIIIGIFKH